MHDRSGNPIAVGDTVSITGKIKNASPGSTACEIEVEFEIPMNEDSSMSCWFNSKQVEKMDKENT